MNNKIGINSISLVRNYPDDFEAIIRKAASLGFDVVELFTAFLVDLPDARLKEYRKIADDQGIELAFSTGLGAEQDLSSNDAAIRKAGIDHVKRTLDIIHMLGGDCYAGLTYAAWGAKIKKLEEKPVRIENSIRCLKELTKIAEDYGIQYCMEIVNRFESFMLNTAQEGLAIIDAVGSPNLKLHLDTFHMSIEEDHIMDALEETGDRLGFLHLGESNRRLPGTGDFPWDRLFGTLKKINYNGVVSMEPFVMAGGNIADDVFLWRDLSHGATEAEMDESTRNAIAFIRNRLAMQ